MSAKSAPQMLSLCDKYTLRFSNFVIIGLYNSLANCYFDIFTFLAALLIADFLSKNL